MKIETVLYVVAGIAIAIAVKKVADKVKTVSAMPGQEIQKVVEAVTAGANRVINAPNTQELHDKYIRMEKASYDSDAPTPKTAAQIFATPRIDNPFMVF